MEEATCWNGSSVSSTRTEEAQSSATITSHMDADGVKATMKFIIIFPKRQDRDCHVACQVVDSGKSKMVSSSKPDHYFHVEYYPFPGSDLYKVDCITYGLGAKVTHTKGVTYLSDEIVQIHSYQSISWVAFTRPHYLQTETDTELENIFDHKIELRLCDDKSAVTNRSKHDKPKGFRVSTFAEVGLVDNHWWSDIVRDTATKMEKGLCQQLKPEGDLPDGQANIVIKSTRINDKVEKMKNKLQKAERFADITFDMSEFYFDDQQVTNLADMTSRLEANVIMPTWISFGAKLELDRMIMTPQQERRYNPMVISFGQLGPMPSTPIPPSALANLCKPVHIGFECFGRKFISRRVPHAEQLSINSKHVILTGRIPPNEIIETFRKGRFKFEIHDRDRKKVVHSSSLFGANKSDRLWARLDQTKFMNILAKSKLKNSRGIAYLAMSDFSKGLRRLNVTLPVVPKEEMGSNSHQQRSLPAGHYLDACTELSIKVQLKFPYFSSTPVEIPTVALGLIVVITNRQSPYLTLLKQTAIDFNHSLESTSSQYASGFHIQCANYHYFTVEGPVGGIIKELWHIPRHNDGCTIVLYDSSMLFSLRQYDSLDRAFSRIQLNFDLTQTLQNGLIHCQSFLPRVVLSAFIKLSLYSKIASLEKLYAADKILTEDEVNSLKKDFESLFDGHCAFDNIMEISLAILDKQKPKTADANDRQSNLICKKSKIRPRTVNSRP